MEYFQTKNINLGKFWRVLQWKVLVYFWQCGLCTYLVYILWPFAIFYGYLVHIFPFWYVVPRNIWQPWFRLPPFTPAGFDRTTHSSNLLVVEWRRYHSITAFTYYVCTRTHPALEPGSKKNKTLFRSLPSLA
jgi:hypothetical protein